MFQKHNKIDLQLLTSDLMSFIGWFPKYGICRSLDVSAFPKWYFRGPFDSTQIFREKTCFYSWSRKKSGNLIREPKIVGRNCNSSPESHSKLFCMNTIFSCYIIIWEGPPYTTCLFWNKAEDNLKIAFLSAIIRLLLTQTAPLNLAKGVESVAKFLWTKFYVFLELLSVTLVIFLSKQTAPPAESHVNYRDVSRKFRREQLPRYNVLRSSEYSEINVKCHVSLACIFCEFCRRFTKSPWAACHFLPGALQLKWRRPGSIRHEGTLFPLALGHGRFCTEWFGWKNEHGHRWWSADSSCAYQENAGWFYCDTERWLDRFAL